MSMCRQIAGTLGNVSEAVTGTRATWGCPNRQENRPTYMITGENAWRFQGRDNQPYDAEHVALINSIRNNQPINDLKNVAESTLTAIMGRMAAYTGQEITWEKAMNSKEDLSPPRYDWDVKLPDPPIAIPGVTKFV